MDVRKITKQDCLAWTASYTSSAENFNRTVQTLRLILEIPVESGIRYDIALNEIFFASIPVARFDGLGHLHRYRPEIKMRPGALGDQEMAD